MQLKLCGSARARLPRTDHRAACFAPLPFSEPTQIREVTIEKSLEFSDVQVLFDTGMSLVCLVDGIRVRIPSHLMRPGTEVRANGDCGTLVLPRSVALSVGLV